MFNEFTSSNAESEHASLKKKAGGVNNKISMNVLLEKTLMEAGKKVIYAIKLNSKTQILLM